MEKVTTHHSFILRPSLIKSAGVGVFSLQDIAKDTYMELFLKDFQEEILDEQEVPKELRIYCPYQGCGKILCPKFFNRMDIGNYLNHSNHPNLKYEKGKGYFALRDIKAGEELLANYRELEEPEDGREDYYR